MAQRKKPAPIFEALNNSLLFAMALIGLAIYVYQNDQNNQDRQLETTTIFLEGLQKKQDSQNDILLRMQEAQIAIAKQIERNTDKINAVNTDRFTDRDGSMLRSNISEKLEDERIQRRQQQTENRNSITALSTELESLKLQLMGVSAPCDKQQ